MEKKENNKLFINIHKDLSISVRTSNILKNQGIIFIKDLIQCNEKKILSFRQADFYFWIGFVRFWTGFGRFWICFW